jgi:hypothetical protein
MAAMITREIRGLGGMVEHMVRRVSRAYPVAPDPLSPTRVNDRSHCLANA